MKKGLLLLGLACMAAVACTRNDGEETTTITEIDRSLAGSIALDAYRMEVECSDGEDVEGALRYDRDGYIYIKKMADDKVALLCLMHFDSEELSVEIPLLPLSGKPYDAAFDAVCAEAAVTVGERRFEPVSATVEGRIKRTKAPRSSVRIGLAELTRPAYDCEIGIRCTVDGAAMEFRVLSVSAY